MDIDCDVSECEEPMLSHKKPHEHKIEAQELLYKLHVVETNRGWNKAIENNVKEIGERAIVYAWMNNALSGSLERWDRVGGIVPGALNLLVGTSIFGTLSTCSNNTIIIIITGILAYLVSVIALAHFSQRFSVRASKFHLSTIKFASLGENIKRQLSLYRRNRQEAGPYTDWIAKEYSNILLSSDPIPNRIVSSFHKKFPNVKISLPDIAGGGMEEIAIKAEAIIGTPDIEKGSTVSESSQSPIESVFDNIHQELKKKSTLTGSGLCATDYDDPRMAFILSRYLEQ